MRHHVFTTTRATEERQDAPLLERRREQASRRRPGGAEARSVFGRDQLVAGGGVAPGGRGARYRRRRPPDAGLVPRGSWRGGVGGRRLGGAAAPVRNAPESSAAVGRIALVVTPEGLPLAYEVLPGNTADGKTLRTFLSKIEKQYGKAGRVWVMDRGVPTEAVLVEMRASDPNVQYLVGTPKGRLNRLEKHLIEKPWQKARAGVDVKLLTQDDELYVFAQSADRVAKERAMRRRQLKWLWARQTREHERDA